MFCKHDWMVLDKTILPSPFQQIAESGLKHYKGEPDSQAFFRTKVVVLVACKKCGAKREHTTSNPCETA